MTNLFYRNSHFSEVHRFDTNRALIVNGSWLIIDWSLVTDINNLTQTRKTVVVPKELRYYLKEQIQRLTGEISVH
ncbi:hypothetical protein Sta7437_1668 [Stanieria cyanosphaera PCC 7437]|uniref:Uncharacterized protein n=1 Tax=Stanieria cyanosphaera (strain ATCC 29371 / PCC 7437) TaxID=111780 RepID=K9XRI8_STAC7|nr:hypothetical protein Sta7437_1668 [Stanieria cyanosphaera PCC 7437]